MHHHAPVTDRAVRPLSLFVFWSTSAESIFHLNYRNEMSYKRPKSEHWDMLAQLFPGFAGKAGTADTSVHLRGEKARAWRTELSNPKDVSLELLLKEGQRW